MNTNFVQRVTCPGCGSTDSKEIHQVSFSNDSIKQYLLDFYNKQGSIDYNYLEKGNYVLDECNSCGLIYQREILNDFLMEKLYEEWIDPKRVFEEEERSFKLDYYARYSQEIGTLISYFNAVPTQLKFFDFGMGWGKWLRMVQGFGVQAFGTELSESRINYAKKFGINVVSWDELVHHKFDLINTEQVFEHIPQPLETLNHLIKALKPGGLIKISVPNGAGIKRRLKVADWKAPKYSKNSLNAVSPLEHINCFNGNAIIKMAEEAGLQRVNIPLKAQYAFMFNNTAVRNILANLAKPLFRNFTSGTYLFFTLNRK